ncbi:hypothetical protein [Luteimonas terricola]|uniref:Tip attachment protein J domain-containing protein n=1 Tax=Luteimonas terricola TaxID=645597 RepID=A0ABQ2EE19_9GAMM|nr:hypothetical protein [Luteimonas terricola]GGK08499.1 hypothetical protein GCM10011394_17340 [Luteimonas terricola]
MGKSSKPTIGYWHQLLLYIGVCHGPVDALRKVEWGGEDAWEGNQTTSGDIFIDKPELFGGEKKEGGIKGTLSVRMGEPTQMPHFRMLELRPGPWPAARGLMTLVYDGIVGAFSPYVKTCRWLVSRWFMGWEGAVWQPTLCKIGEGMNAAHLAYQTLTHTDWGYGASPADIIDEANLLGMAQTLADEGFGLCLKWSRSESVGTFLTLICNHVGAQWGVRDDKIVFTLYRGNYDVEALPLIDESNIVSLEEWSDPLVTGGAVNEVTVVGFDCMTGKDIARTYANLASIQATGQVVSEKIQLPGLWNLDLVDRVAARECHAKSMMPQRVKVTVKASAGPFVRGEVRAISWARKQVHRMPVRVEEIDEGTLTDSAVTLVLLQDVAGMAQTSYIADVGTGWVAPDTTPRPLDPEHVYEATYRDLVGIMRPADLAMMGDEAGYLVAVGARPVGPAYNFTLFTRTASAPFAEVGSGDFSPNGVLASGLGPTATLITLNSHRGLAGVAVGEECIIGGVEHCRVTSINAGTGEVGIARGCVDTVPRSPGHVSGTLVWFPDTYHGYDPTEYLDGETVDAKLRTRTSSGTLAEAEAVTRSVAMAGRQFRPYPPGRLRIEGQAYPATVTGASITAEVADRDRLLQADQLVDSDQVSIGPEPGTTKTFRWYLGGVLARTEAGVAGSSDTFIPAGAGVVRVEVECVRDGATSWQALSHEFGFQPA